MLSLCASVNRTRTTYCCTYFSKRHKTFLLRLFNSSVQYLLNISKCDEPNEKIHYRYIVTTILFPLHIYATSYFACQLHGDFALSIKQRITCCCSARFLFCADPSFISYKQAQFFVFERMTVQKASKY
jgi:hypothetical protein